MKPSAQVKLAKQIRRKKRQMKLTKKKIAERTKKINNIKRDIESLRLEEMELDYEES